MNVLIKLFNCAGCLRGSLLGGACAQQIGNNSHLLIYKKKHFAQYLPFSPIWDPNI